MQPETKNTLTEICMLQRNGANIFYDRVHDAPMECFRKESQRVDILIRLEGIKTRLREIENELL